mgnify:FL=1
MAHPHPHGHVPPPQQPAHAQPPFHRPPPGSARAGVPLTGPHPVGAHGPGSARYWQADPDERQMAMFVHLGALLTGFIVPLVLFVLKKDESPFIRDHARHALNAQISYLLWTIAGFIVFGILGFVLALVTFGLGFVIVYAALLPLLALAAFEIIACVKANEGAGYRIPLVIEFIR